MILDVEIVVEEESWLHLYRKNKAPQIPIERNHIDTRRDKRKGKAAGNKRAR